MERFKINCCFVSKNFTATFTEINFWMGITKMTADVISDLFEAFFVTVMISFYPLKKNVMLKRRKKKKF